MLISDGLEKKVILERDNFLSFHPECIDHTYGVLVRYPEKDIVMHYEIACQYKQQVGDGHFLMSMDRKQVFINREIPDLKLYQMADIMVKAFYPIELIVSKTDLQVKKINNHPEILTRGQQAEQQLKLRYEGELADTFAQQFNRQYSNSNILMDRLQQELFYKLFFFPLYTRYDGESKAVSEFSFPLNTDQDDPLLQVTQTLSPAYTNDDMLELHVKGIPYKDAATPVNEAGFEACYHLYASDHTIRLLTGTAFYKTKEGKKSTIEFEIYHLDPEKREEKKSIITPVATTAGTFFIDPVETRKKRSFWNIFN